MITCLWHIYHLSITDAALRHAHTLVLFYYKTKHPTKKPKVKRNTEQKRIDIYLILSDLKLV